MDDVVSVIIVDDHEIFRMGLEVMLSSLPYINIIGEASNSTQLFNLLKKREPDIIFMDIDLGGEYGVDVARRVLAKYPYTYIIAITSSDEIRYFKDMIDAGAVGFLLKNISKEELNTALKEIIAGNQYFSKEFLLIARSLNSSSKAKKSKIQLSDREKEVLRLICQGCSNQEVADELNLSPHTVDSHRRNLLSKTNARNTAEMIMISFRDGLINYE